MNLVPKSVYDYIKWKRKSHYKLSLRPWRRHADKIRNTTSLKHYQSLRTDRMQKTTIGEEILFGGHTPFNFL